MNLSLLLPTVFKKAFFLLFIALLSVSMAHALDLSSAKKQGLVGEGNDGYLGYVVTPASDEVEALVKEVNSKRKTIFENTAKKNNISSQQVALRFYERAVTKTATGRYYQNASGKWIIK